jgi:predicted RNA polymerase sigma factor
MTLSKSPSGAGLALLLLCAANFLDAMDVSTIGVALPAIQAELWREAGDIDRAVACYRTALGLARSAPEQRWLTSRLTLLV